MMRTIVDVHAHLWLGPSLEQNEREILRAMDRYEIARVCVSTLEGERLRPDSDLIRRCNDATERFLKQDKRLRGYCYVNPGNPDVLEELKRGYDTPGMCGVKLWVSHYCSDPAVFPVVEFCVERGWPVLIHSFYKAVGQLPNETTGVHVAQLARRYPQAKLIMAHLGANCYDGIKAVRDCTNVMVDISGTICRRDDVDYTVECIGADRVLFGTDMPSPGNFLANVGRVLEADLTEEQREKIFWKNAVSLWGEGLEAD